MFIKQEQCVQFQGTTNQEGLSQGGEILVRMVPGLRGVSYLESVKKIELSTF